MIVSKGPRGKDPRIRFMCLKDHPLKPYQTAGAPVHAAFKMSLPARDRRKYVEDKMSSGCHTQIPNGMHLFIIKPP
jgi:hypothetical protein